MALTLKSTAKTGLGKMVIYMNKGTKTTECIWCSRSEAIKSALQFCSINGSDSEISKIIFNGREIFLS